MTSPGGYTTRSNRVNAHQNIHKQTLRRSKLKAPKGPAQSMKLDFKSSLLIEQYWMGFSKGFMGEEEVEDNDNLRFGNAHTQLIVC